MPKNIKYSSRGCCIEPTSDFSNLCDKHNLNIDGKIVLLTRNNADVIEKLLKDDNTYIPFAKIVFDSFEKNAVMENKNKALFIVAREIDRDNNTNAWRYNKNHDSFNNMIKYISNKNNKFFERLNSGDQTLPDDIVEKCGTGVKSLSSKICKYLCEYIYNKDNFYINDSVVRNMLLFYLDYYGVKHPKLKSIYGVDNLKYSDYYELLSKLHTERNSKHKDSITKSELDHIIWYCYKSFK